MSTQAVRPAFMMGEQAHEFILMNRGNSSDLVVKTSSSVLYNHVSQPGAILPPGATWQRLETCFMMGVGAVGI